MRPGLRLVFDSVEGDPFSVGALMQIWAGDLLEEDHSPDLLKYEVSSKPRDGAVQKTLVQIKTAGEDEDTDNPARTIVLFEVAMMLEEGEEGEGERDAEEGEAEGEGEGDKADFPCNPKVFPKCFQVFPMCFQRRAESVSGHLSCYAHQIRWNLPAKREIS